MYTFELQFITPGALRQVEIKWRLSLFFLHYAVSFQGALDTILNPVEKVGGATGRGGAVSAEASASCMNDSCFW